MSSTNSMGTGTTRSATKAKRNMEQRIKAKVARGERLTKKENRILSKIIAEFGGAR